MAGLRYAKIGLAVFIALIVPGVFLVRNAGDAAIQAVGAVSFIAGCAVYLILDMRAERRQKEEAQ
jgi:hypothetical protein